MTSACQWSLGAPVGAYAGLPPGGLVHFLLTDAAPSLRRNSRADATSTPARLASKAGSLVVVRVSHMFVWVSVLLYSIKIYE
jgi:hypothetical protein